MQVLVVANREDPETGYVGEALEAAGGHLARRWRDDARHLGIEQRADLVLLLGSDWSVYDVSHRGEIEAERALVLEAHRRGTPVFAICFGAQLVASAFGAPVSRAPKPEVGWKTVDSADTVACPHGPWFQLHGDRWGIAEKLTPCAWNAIGPQAFWLGRTFAVQFHPEVDRETADRWLQAVPATVEAAGEDLPTILEQNRLLESTARERCHRLVEQFLSTVLVPTKLPG